MIKQIIFVSLVAFFAYHAGAKGLTPVKVINWFDEREITETIEEVFNKTVEIAEKKKIAEKELNNLYEILIRSDLENFAKTRPIEDENIESIKLATEFILVTKELYNHA